MLDSATAWVDAGELRSGDEILLRGADGAIAPTAVTEASTWPEDVEVHALSVSAPHTYFVGGALVHNY